MRNYVTYAMGCLNERGYTAVTLRGMGRAVSKTVAIGARRRRRRCHAGRP